MNVVNIHAGSDTGGQGIRLKWAFDRHAPGWTYHTVRNPQTSFAYIDYPQDRPWSEAKDLWADADVVHVINNFRSAALFERKRGEKPAVVHYQGTSFRTGPWPLLAEQRKRHAIGLVSTLDLFLIEPSRLEWLPSPYDIDWLWSLRTPINDGKVRIAHAPTNRTIKSTDKLEQAIDRLKREGYPVELELIEKVRWFECLRRKASADIFFDQVKLGYGNNAIEAWGMGIPVIAGGADPTLDEMERRFGHLPFLHATPDTIYDALRELVESPELRQKYADRGLEHVRRYHAEQVVVEQLKDIYTRAAGMRGERAA
jgi:hypothetical protein